MTHSEAGARNLADMGAAVAQVSAFDAAAVEQAVRDARAEVVIDELTSLPKSPSEIAAVAPGDRKLKIEGGRNLHSAAMACGVRRYIQQASGFFLEPGGDLADESAGLFVGAPPPPRITEEQALALAGEDAVYYGTKLRGASNQKAKKTFGFEPRHLLWLGLVGSR